MNDNIKQVGGGRNHAIDLMKFLAAILITNSHMGALYPEKFRLLSTGGSIGDALFFFCSGFCLMLGSNKDFFNWYKRRINRIFPAIFAIAIIGIVFLGHNPTLKHLIIKGGGWFVQAIFLFYAIFWFVMRFIPNKLWIAFAINTVILLVWFVWYWDKYQFILANGTYLRWPGFFMVMLMGATVSRSARVNETHKEVSGWVQLSALIALLLLYYGYQFLWDRFQVLKSFQIVLLPTLMGIIFMFYKLCSNMKVLSLYQNKYLYWVLYGISACCLEIYLSGNMSFWVGVSLIRFFPLNLVVTFVLVFIVAYLVKVFSNFLSQTFKNENYNWKGMVKL